MQSYTIRPAIALRILFDIIIISILKPLLLCVREESKEDNKRRFDFTRFVMPPKWWYIILRLPLWAKISFSCIKFWEHLLTSENTLVFKIFQATKIFNPWAKKTVLHL